MEVLHSCLDESEEDEIQEFSVFVWSMLPEVLSRALIDINTEIDANICHLLELATSVPPLNLDQTLCLNIAVLITTMFSKHSAEHSPNTELKCQYEYACLKLSLHLLGLTTDYNDNRVLLTLINRAGFIASVLNAANSPDERVACAALQLLSNVIHYFVKGKYQPKIILQIQTHLVIKSLRESNLNERGASILQLVYMILSTGANTPLVLLNDIGENPSQSHQCSSLRTLLFRIQMMCCREESTEQSLAAWKTLSAVFKHAVIAQNDTKLIVILTSQPWTHILINFQLTQKITKEFLTFVINWLTLLMITLNKSLEEHKIQMSNQGLIMKTMVLIKKNLVIEEEFKEDRQKVMNIVTEILKHAPR